MIYFFIMIDVLTKFFITIITIIKIRTYTIVTNFHKTTKVVSSNRTFIIATNCHSKDYILLIKKYLNS